VVGWYLIEPIISFASQSQNERILSEIKKKKRRRRRREEE
jgi:hypothetical protein